MRRVRDGTWVIFLVLGILGAMTAPILLSGRVPNPPSPETTTGLTFEQMVARVPGLETYVASISRQLGNFMLVAGVLMAMVAAVPFRRGERWAWWSMWTVPVLLLIQFVNSNFGRGWWEDLGLLPVTIAGLLLPYRKFFPRRA
jgi:hypothetical protein